MSREVALVHPGEILLKDWLEPLGISQYALAKAIGVPRRRINEIIHGKRAITADTAARLGAFFDVDAHGWVALQAHYDAELACERLGDALAQIPRYDRIAAARATPGSAMLEQ
jgi:addiction module HigA family antidote